MKGIRGDDLRSGLGGDAADFDLGPTEIDRQAQGLTRLPQVVLALPDIYVAQCVHHLQFDDDLIRDQMAGGKFANDQVVLEVGRAPLLDGAEAAPSHLAVKSGLADLFDRPMTERIGNPECTEQDPGGATGRTNRASPSSPLIPFICLKKRLS